DAGLQVLDKLNYTLVDLLGSLLLGPMTATWSPTSLTSPSSTDTTCTWSFFRILSKSNGNGTSGGHSRARPVRYLCPDTGLGNRSGAEALWINPRTDPLKHRRRSSTCACAVSA